MNAEDATELISTWEGRLHVATRNGPVSTVVAGDVEAVEELILWCEGQEVRARRIDVDYASHTPHIDQLHDTLAEMLRPVTPQQGRVPFYSTVTGHTGGPMADTTVMDATYWFDNLRHTVAFDTTITTLLDADHTLFIEASPHPVLTIGINDTI
ncbi:acyltransferase domain-containing protein, partial [Streptomyces mayteni]